MNNAQPQHESVQPQSRARAAAVVQAGYGRPQDVLTLGEIDRPVPGPSEVLVRMRASSVNTPDLVAVTGEPRILRLRSGLRGPGVAVRGSDLAGVVAEVGADVTAVRPGDEVFGSVWNNKAVQAPGTFAEFAVVPASQIIARPAGVSLEQAGASVMAGVTALIGMRDVAAITPGTRVLINGASGGVGTFAVQIAKWLGAEVTAVCSARNIDFVRSLGADHVIDYTSTDFTQSGERYDVVLDNVMNHAPAATVRVLAPGGVFIPNSVGTSGGMFAGLPRMARAGMLGLRRSVNVRFITCTVDQDKLRDLAGLLESGAVSASIERTYPLGDTASAVGHMLGRHARGKIAITMDEA